MTTFNKKYTLSFRDRYNKLYRIDIYKKNYLGSTVSTLEGTSNPVVMNYAPIEDDKLFPIRAASLTINIYCNVDYRWMEFCTTDPTEFQVRLFRVDGSTDNPVFYGYLNDNQYSEPFDAQEINYQVSFVAVDGLARLKNETFDYTSYKTFYDYLSGMLSKVKMLSLNWNSTNDIRIYTDNSICETGTLSALGEQGMWDKIYFNPANFSDSDDERKSCYDALKEMLANIGACIFQYNGNWHVRHFRRMGIVQRYINDNTSSLTHAERIFNSETPYMLPNRDNKLFLVGGDATLNSTAFVKAFKLKVTYGLKDSILNNYDFSSWYYNTVWVPTTSTRRANYYDTYQYLYYWTVGSSTRIAKTDDGFMFKNNPTTSTDDNPANGYCKSLISDKIHCDAMDSDDYLILNIPYCVFTEKIVGATFNIYVTVKAIFADNSYVCWSGTEWTENTVVYWNIATGVSPSVSMTTFEASLPAIEGEFDLEITLWGQDYNSETGSMRVHTSFGTILAYFQLSSTTTYPKDNTILVENLTDAKSESTTEIVLSDLPDVPNARLMYTGGLLRADQTTSTEAWSWSNELNEDYLISRIALQMKEENRYTSQTFSGTINVPDIFTFYPGRPMVHYWNLCRRFLPGKMTYNIADTEVQTDMSELLTSWQIQFILDQYMNRNYHDITNDTAMVERLNRYLTEPTTDIIYKCLLPADISYSDVKAQLYEDGITATLIAESTSQVYNRIHFTNTYWSDHMFVKLLNKDNNYVYATSADRMLLPASFRYTGFTTTYEHYRRSYFIDNMWAFIALCVNGNYDDAENLLKLMYSYSFREYQYTFGDADNSSDNKTDSTTAMICTLLAITYFIEYFGDDTDGTMVTNYNSILTTLNSSHAYTSGSLSGLYGNDENGGDDKIYFEIQFYLWLSFKRMNIMYSTSVFYQLMLQSLYNAITSAYIKDNTYFAEWVSSSTYGAESPASAITGMLFAIINYDSQCKAVLRSDILTRCKELVIYNATQQVTGVKVSSSSTYVNSYLSLMYAFVMYAINEYPEYITMLKETGKYVNEDGGIPYSEARKTGEFPVNADYYVGRYSAVATTAMYFIALRVPGILTHNITINDMVNIAPEITSTAITTVISGELYEYDVIATDANADTLTYSLSNAPDGMSIDAETGVITWTPAWGTTTSGAVTITVSDGELTATQTFTVTVRNAPHITSTAPTSGTAGTEYTYAVAATDPDGDTLTYSLSNAPDGMSIDAETGVITWTPASGTTTSGAVTITVSDGELTATETFTVIVGIVFTYETVGHTNDDNYIASNNTYNDETNILTTSLDNYCFEFYVNVVPSRALLSGETCRITFRGITLSYIAYSTIYTSTDGIQTEGDNYYIDLTLPKYSEAAQMLSLAFNYPPYQEDIETYIKAEIL